jgi:hypothetical protein
MQLQRGRSLTFAIGAAALWLVGCERRPPGTGVPPTPISSDVLEVTIESIGPPTCNPVGRPLGCLIPLKAVARNAEAAQLSYVWTGASILHNAYCSSPQYPENERANCSILSPEQVVVAAVTVRDARGREASSTLRLTGEGTNHPPTVRFSPPFTLPGGSPTLEMFGIIDDPDEGQLCLAPHVVSASASGDCQQQATISSSCLEGGPTLDVYRTKASGSCEATVQVRDSAGLAGTSVFTIRY